MTVVHLRHARMIKRQGGRPLCATGIRAWCARHEVPWDEFTGAGVPVDRFRSIDDHYAGVLIKLAEEEQGHGQQ